MKNARQWYTLHGMSEVSTHNEELDTILQNHNIKTAAILETKKKKTPKTTVIYSGVKQSVRAQLGVMIWVHKSISKTVYHYRYWSDRILKIRCKINRGYLTILGLYAPEEGRQELTDDFYLQLQNIYDKVNKNY
jgi:hypothetical protein